MKTRFLLQLTAPALLTGLVLIGTSLGSAWSIHRLQVNLTTILSESVASVQASSDLENRMRQLRYHSFLYMIRPDEQSWRAITAGLSSVESQLTRAMLWWTAIDLCESQVIGVDEMVALADRHLRPETHPLVFEGVMRGLQSIARRYSTPGEVAGHVAVIADIARDEHFNAREIFETVQIAQGETVKIPAVLPKLSETPGGTDWIARATIGHLGCLMLARIDGKSPVEYLKQEGVRERVRRFARRLILEPPATVEEVFACL